MPHRTMGRLHAELTHLIRRLGDPERGQGTVEYVALLLLVAGVMTAVVAAGKGQNFNIAKTVGTKLNEVIGTVGDAKR